MKPKARRDPSRLSTGYRPIQFRFPSGVPSDTVFATWSRLPRDNSKRILVGASMWTSEPDNATTSGGTAQNAQLRRNAAALSRLKNTKPSANDQPTLNDSQPIPTSMSHAKCHPGALVA
jgi:hypothetical protein